MEELYSFVWSFLPALLAKKTTEKKSSAKCYIDSSIKIKWGDYAPHLVHALPAIQIP